MRASTDSTPRSAGSLAMREAYAGPGGSDGELEARIHHLHPSVLLPDDPFHHDAGPQREAADRAPAHELDRHLAGPVGDHDLERLVVLHRKHREPPDHA